MTQKEYSEKRQTLLERKSQLEREMKNLDNQYLNDNEFTKKFKIGEKIKFISGKKIEYGFIESFMVDHYTYKIKPTILKCKKDGSPSKLHLYYYDGLDTIEKITE